MSNSVWNTLNEKNLELQMGIYVLDDGDILHVALWNSKTNKFEPLPLNYFKKNRTLLNILLVSISLLLSFSLIPSMFFNNSPDEFVTNGSILIHFAPLFLCIGLIVRFFTNYIQTEKIKNALIKKKLPSYNKKNEYLFIISNWLFIFFFIITISGFILD